MPLTYKFVLGSLAVAGAAMALPGLVRASGLDFPAWGSFFAALGAGGAIGFVLSSIFGRKFSALLEVTEQIRGGDLRVAVSGRAASTFPDETDDLAGSLREMIGNLRDMVSHVQETGRSVRTAALG